VLADRFGKKEMISVLFLPALLGVFLWSIHAPYFRSGVFEVDFFNVINFIVLVDLFHLFTTFWFTVGNRSLFKKIYKTVLTVSLFSIALNYSLAYFFGLNALLRVVAYCVLIHTVIQQFAWLQKSFDFKTDVTTFNVYKLLFLNCAFLPLIYWHTGAGNFSNYYIYPNTISYFLPEWCASAVIGISIAALAGSFFYLAVRRKLMLKPLLIILFTWIIYFFGIVVTGSFLLFICLLVMTHAIGYVVYALIFSETGKSRLLQSPGWLNSIPAQLSAILLLTLLWKFSVDSNVFQITGNPNFIPFKVLPTTLHLALDSFIWRKNFILPALQKSA
jgi:hypothetical protein